MTPKCPDCKKDQDECSCIGDLRICEELEFLTFKEYKELLNKVKALEAEITRLKSIQGESK